MEILPRLLWGMLAILLSTQGAAASDLVEILPIASQILALQSDDGAVKYHVYHQKR
jgi:hypothetical protein